MKECCKYFGCSLSSENVEGKQHDIYVCVGCSDAWKIDSVTKEKANMPLEEKQKHMDHYKDLRNHMYAMQAQKDKLFAEKQAKDKEKLAKTK